MESEQQLSALNRRRTRRIVAVGSAAAVVATGGILWGLTSSNGPAPQEAPEAERILQVQPSIPFEILIPAQLPQEFNREEVQIDVTQLGPSGEPMIQLTYQNQEGDDLYLREWVPIDPDKEILAGSQPVETVWGPGWLRTQGNQLIVLWADVGPVRVSTFANSQEVVSQAEIFRIVSTLGPASQAEVEVPEDR